MELWLPGKKAIQVRTTEELRSALSLLAEVPEGGIAELRESDKHSIRAERDDAYWRVTAKRRGWWFRQTLTTGGWIAPRSRKLRPWWVARGMLSEEKVVKVFIEFFEGRKFSQPLEGA